MAVAGCVPLPHDVAVEGVEDALVGELQRVVQDLHVLAALGLRSVAVVQCGGQLFLPHLGGTRTSSTADTDGTVGSVHWR